MKRIHRMIIRMLPGPFFGWLGMLMFLLLMQFLIRHLKDIVGKGLPTSIILELIVYNLAYMVVLAVPMSVLIATLMGFGRLAESRSYIVIKSAGVSFPQLLWPTLVAGVLVTACMVYFNNEVLPEANFRAKNLWQDIYRKKPGFQLKPGVFYGGLNGYSILVQDRPAASDELFDVTIYDYTNGARQQTVIKAERGRLEPVGQAQLDLFLDAGEIHRAQNNTGLGADDRYERLAFERYRLRLDLSDLAFERSDPREGYRSDRTMRTGEMQRFVDSLDASLARHEADLNALVATLASDSLAAHVSPTDASSPPTASSSSAPSDSVVTREAAPQVALAGLDLPARRVVFDLALHNARTARTRIDDAWRTIRYEQQRANRYRVEIHKKYSIAVACLIFALIGAPLGLSIRRGGLGTAGALATGIFMFYWVTLVQGEKFADRDFLAPWIGMWGANLVMLVGGLFLTLYVTLDLHATPPLRRRLFSRKTRTTPDAPRPDPPLGPAGTPASVRPSE